MSRDSYSSHSHRHGYKMPYSLLTHLKFYDYMTIFPRTEACDWHKFSKLFEAIRRMIYIKPGFSFIRLQSPLLRTIGTTRVYNESMMLHIKRSSSTQPSPSLSELPF
jgi:hypothetical protein